MSVAAYPAAAEPDCGIDPANSGAVLLEYEDALADLSVELVLVAVIEVFLSEQVE